ncbi:uncharacterized protein LOC130907200 [Corythoichthys intestinalis]|uniref:uncharacterized protein LOC130907200 n=1 Tax=Corythoichthys intestinalis TaxID=161448 RepID=UPI0025A5B491|nr:uncharacterized protein LOC130907200 [Corythoichthys intestinalis]
MPHTKENVIPPAEETTQGNCSMQTVFSHQVDVKVETRREVDQSQVGTDDEELPPEIKKTGRTRKLTEKGMSLLNDKLSNLNGRIVKMYKRWKYHMNGLKRSIKDKYGEDLIEEVINEINAIQVDIDETYLQIRDIAIPEPDIRRINDTCQALTKTANLNAQQYRSGDDKDILWPDSKSVFDSTVSSIYSATTSKSKTSSKSSSHSSILSLNVKQAEAEVVATQEVLKIINAQHQQREEIERLELEDQIVAAEIEAENAKKKAKFSASRKFKLEQKRREIKRQEELKGHVAAQARFQVYSEALNQPTTLNPLSEPFFPSHQAQVSMASEEQSKSVQVQHQHDVKPIRTAVPNVFIQTSPSVPPVSSQVPTTQAPVPLNASNDLARTIAEAITANRVPIPEPEIFTGDPLKYNDWKLSFCTLIDRKNLPTQEKLFYLRKYVGDTAKRAIEGHFIIGTESAYCAAWNVLEERFGNPFVVAKSYRDKIYAWHKIGHKDFDNLRDFVDFLSSVESAMPYIQGLQILNDCVENQKITVKLPDWLSSRWNREVTIYQDQNSLFPDFKFFVRFLNTETRIACNPITSLHALKPAEQERSKPTEREQSKFQRSQKVSVKTFTTNTSEKTSLACLFCKKKGHSLHRCRKIMENTVEERVKFVQLEKLCFGCLKSGHNSKVCKSRSVCELCGKGHPTCLHRDRAKKDQEQSLNNKQENKTESHADNYQQLGNEETRQVTSNRVIQEINSTRTSSIVPVYVSTIAEPERELLMYALLDSQSDTTFILEDAAETLCANKTPVELKVSTITSKTKVVKSQRVQGLQVRGLNSETKIKLPKTYTRDYIPANRSHIPTSSTAKSWPHLKHLADEMSPELDCEVGLLIGYDCPQALLPRKVVMGNENQPYAQRSVLGWSIIGNSNTDIDYHHEDGIGVSHHIIMRKVLPATKSSSEIKTEVQFVCRTQVKEVITPADILKVFESDFTEKFSEEICTSQEDITFLKKLNDGIKQKRNGHYEMPLPFKEDRPSLPNNKVCAEHRLRCLEKRLNKNDQYRSDYVAFMDDIIARGDAEKVPESEINNQSSWYVPHHGVYHPHKPGKVRVVFDCSAKFQNTSLNEHLLTGPDLTNTLVGVLLRFRKGQVAIMCDVERMFHQFHVASKDQDYLRFLWWEKGNMEIPPSVFRMKVHLFGAASSPGCANFGLKHLAAEGTGKSSEATVKFIQRNFYVDDGLISLDSEEEAIQLVREARELCNAGKLHLHKFITNNKNVLATIPKQERAEGVADLDLALGEHKMERALGVQWCISSDKFQFKVRIKTHPFTRRGVLSTVASIFDPLGFVAPVILKGKQILQRMCQEKLGWDEPISEELRLQWEALLQDIQDLSFVEIPRHYIPLNAKEVHKYELHHFSDASTSGYGMCSYLRAVSESGKVHCVLVMAKARVAPTKITTIPRLELSATLLATRISDLLKSEMEIEDLHNYFWTDSKVVLGYINNDEKRFHLFVANRIQQIKTSTTPSQWQYVASEDNPADHASRGRTTKELVKSNWFTGPSFLWHKNLPTSENMKVGELDQDDPEIKRAHVHTTKTKEQRSLLDRLQNFSDWNRTVQAIARLKRLAKQLTGLKTRSNDTTTVEERKDAEQFIIKMVQEEVFRDEIKSLKRAKDLQRNKSFELHKLNPFMDNQGILRVGGRLTQSTLHPHIKHPAILPRGHHVSRLLIKYHHEKIQHQGRGMTINALRSNGIWIIGCSREVSSSIFKCIKCRKFRKCNQGQKMADLPLERMEATPPFTYSGMDCFGPFSVKDGRKELKKYGLLFTCMCSRAVHIEVLDDLSSDAFLNALRCFIAIRGSVSQLRSDQGTNFVGARNEFQELMKGLEQEQLKKLGCDFVMNPPASSHMGGVWERQIRTVRSVLTSVLDQSAGRLDSSSLRTFLYEVMAIVNSRPLSTEHLNDPSGPEPLTPNHILTMKSSIIAPPPGDFTRDDLYLQKRWRRVQFLSNVFWTRWRKEYLLNLQRRSKWNKTRRNTKVDDIVLLQDDCPRNQWRLARVVEVLQGTDGKVRKLKLLLKDAIHDSQCNLKTKPIYIERPIHKTVLLLEAD